LQQFISPLVQVIIIPSLVISNLHMPIVMLQFIIIIPFIIMQQLTMLPLSIVHRFCSMLADIVSSQMHIIFMPPSHFSIFMMQRGMTIMFMPVVPVMGGFMVMPGIIICRSIVIIVGVFLKLKLVDWLKTYNGPAVCGCKEKHDLTA
jgi:hypothetical protein